MKVQIEWKKNMEPAKKPFLIQSKTFPSVFGIFKLLIFVFYISPTGGTTNGHHYDSEEYDEDIDFVPQNGYTDEMPPPVATGGKKEKPER